MITEQETRLMLDRLADLQAERDVIEIHRQQLIDTVLTDEVKAQLREIDEEFAAPVGEVNSKIGELTLNIKERVLAHGKTVKGEYLQAVWVKGRTAWDTKSLAGYAVAHPENEVFRHEGDPSVSLRGVK